MAAGDIDGDIGPVAITTVTVNGPPVALDQSIVTDEDVPLGVTLTAIDIDPLTYTVVAGPAQGTLSGTAPDLTYTPNLDYSGPDSFTFKANDGTSNSNVATVSITVVPAPIFYLHNNPTPPIGGTSSQVGLPFNASVPTASTLYNYDTDRDVAAGLIIQKGGSGASEADPVKYQNWITEPLAEDLTLSGDLEVSFWSAMKDFAGSKLGEVTVYVRDYDGSGYFLIGTGTLDQVDWQGGSASFVQNTMIITGIDYTVSAGHRLEIKFIVGLDSEDDMFFAYDTTTYSSYLTVGP